LISGGIQRITEHAKRRKGRYFDAPDIFHIKAEGQSLPRSAPQRERFQEPTPFFVEYRKQRRASPALCLLQVALRKHEMGDADFLRIPGEVLRDGGQSKNDPTVKLLHALRLPESL